MCLFISSIASGSNGNCYYVGNATEAVLIDAGISCREIEKRMQRLGLSLQNVKGLFISHEHSDHIQGVAVLAKKYKLPVYITTSTLQNSRLYLSGHPVRSFQNHESISVGNLTVTTFSKAHDAVDPFSFTVTDAGIKVGVFTDIGVPCAHLVRHFSECHAAFLEANYDEHMLLHGTYPAHLKARIRGGNGHLSNRQALDLFKNHKPAHMTHLLLAHLSKNNNCPKLVQSLFNAYAGNTQIVVASRYEESAVFQIQSAPVAATTAHYTPAVSQLELAF
jgi:phosphoribosyl 1,2-cyclic phosphodiesterase